VTEHARQPIGDGIVDALRAVPLFLTAPLVRHWHLHWGATDDEVRAPMPGDELVPDASVTATRAVTIDAPPEAVWPWIVQMGYRRGGFYTYDLLDNGGFRSADDVLPEYQHPRVGDWMPMAKTVNETTAFRVAGVAPNQWLLWSKPDSTWAWTLDRRPGDRTRLVVRLKQRYRWERPLSAALTMVLMELGDFAMMRKMLLGIKARAERRGG
jgi:hypothetical protein